MEFIWGILIGLLIGFIVWGYKRKTPFQEYSKIWIDADGGKHVVILRSIDPDRFAALAARINSGHKFRFAALVGRGKLLSRSEWVKLRKELIDREIMQLNRDRTLSPTPLGWQVFKTYADAARAQTPQRRKL